MHGCTLISYVLLEYTEEKFNGNLFVAPTNIYIWKVLLTLFYLSPLIRDS